jgi:hypothetical protein
VATVSIVVGVYLQHKEDTAMAKVYGLHALELKPGVDAQAFERFVLEEFLPLTTVPGQVSSLLKGDRGDRAGHYLLLGEIESPQRRDELFPSTQELSDEIQQMIAKTSATWDKLNTFVVAFPDPHFTDYVAIE